MWAMKVQLWGSSWPKPSSCSRSWADGKWSARAQPQTWGNATTLPANSTASQWVQEHTRLQEKFKTQNKFHSMPFIKWHDASSDSHPVAWLFLLWQGENVARELQALVKDLPAVLEEVGKDAAKLEEHIKLYTAFTNFVCEWWVYSQNAVSLCTFIYFIICHKVSVHYNVFSIHTHN